MLKIALLFLTITNIYHEEYWLDFLRGNEDRYSIYVHSKKHVSDDSFFKKYEMKIKVPTKWEHIMKAQIELLREALKDPDNAKFIFLTESTIPLQNFDTVYDRVMITNKSIFHYWPNPHLKEPDYEPKRILHEIPINLQYKNHSWIILNRKHAQLMVEDTIYLDIITKYDVDSEHYPSTFLAIQGLLNEVEYRQATYDNWSLGKPYTFTNLNKQKQRKPLIKAIQEDKYLFGRKFASNCYMIPLDKYLAYRLPKQ